MSSIDDALNAAFNGPERKKLRIFDHEFNVKPLSISVSGGVTTAYGQISHCLAAVPDDQVYYDTTVQNRQVTGLQRRIENGGFSKIFAAVAPFVAAITHHAEFNSDEIKQAITAAEGFLNGSWQGVVDYMLSLFATQMAAEFSVGQMSAALTLQAGTVGTFAVYGDIRKKYDALDGERSFLGRPTTSETGTPDGIGRFNHFQHGSSTGRPPPAPTRCTASSATNGPRWAGNAARSAIPCPTSRISPAAAAATCSSMGASAGAPTGGAWVG